ncbi:MAG: amino acid adenylation domain-containing protein, partial [Oscillospiraceae bacterium]
QKEVESLAQSIAESVKEIVEYCTSRDDVIYTASDFNDGDLEQDELENILNKLNVIKANEEISKIYELTPLQKGMYYLNEDSIGTGEHVLQYVFDIKSSVNEKNLKQAIQLAVEKYEVLRSRFVTSVSTLNVWNVILASSNYEFCCIDEVKNTAEFELIKEKDRARGFNLENDMLIRSKLIKMSDGKKNLVVSLHHIIVDGWSMPIVFKSIFEFYEELQINSYEDISLVIKEKQNNKILSEYLDLIYKKDYLWYWNELLDGYDKTAIILPQEEKQEDDYYKNTIVLENDISVKINEICSELSITPNIFFEAAWGILLQKYTATSDVVFGKVVSGRNVDIDNIEQAVGLFINTIPVRVYSEKNESIQSLLKKLQKQSIDSGLYDHTSLVSIQENSQLKNNLFSTLFVFENYYLSDDLEKDYSSIKMDFIEVNERTNYPLSVIIFTDDTFKVDIQYDTKIYCEEEIEIILKRFNKLIHQMIQDIKVDKINILENDEYLDLVELSENVKDIDYTKNLVEIFEEQVNIQNNKSAIVFGNEVMSYNELNIRANKLARTLKDNNISNEDVVALFVKRGFNMIISILATLKAGAGYVPISLDTPKERLEYIISRSGAKIALVDELNEFSVKSINVYEESSYSKNGENLNLDIAINNLAYIIYTSGTTGVPKGVEVEHKTVINLTRAFETEFNITDKDKSLQFANYSFDAFVEEFVKSLLIGGELHIITEEQSKDVDFLEKYINENITVVTLPPVVANQIKFENLNVLISAGSEFNANIIENCKNVRHIINAYGPTECTVASTYFKVSKYMKKVPIGRGIINSKIYIMNDDNLCGRNMIGEICIGGDGVSRGYRDSSDLTVEKFIKNPFDEGRIYKTGDLGRWRKDRNIEYLGRIDEQVKIRGFRIELQEVESAMRNIEGVDDAVVVTKEIHNQVMLIAYYTNSNFTNCTSNIKEELEKSLPSYMCPEFFVSLDEIPLTRSGKVYKSKLPELEFKEDYTSPENEIQEKIIEAFREVLNVDKVGINDNFFRIGGHSLRATKAINKIEALLGVRLTIKDIFQYPTAKELERCINTQRKYVSIPKSLEKEFYEMSSTQKRMYMIHKIDENSIAYNMSGCVQIIGDISEERAQNAINEIIKRNEIFRTQFIVNDEMYLQNILKSAECQLESNDFGDLDIEIIMKEFTKPFNLNSDMLIRVMIAKTTMGRYLLIDMHHIISDAMTMGMFISEFKDLYDGKILENKELQYKDYSEWILTKDMSLQQKFWTNELQGIQTLELPYDTARANEKTMNGSNVYLNLDENYTINIIEFCQKYGVTEYMLFVSILNVMLRKYSGQEDIVIGSPVYGRTIKETENIMGMFVNTLPIRTYPSGDKTYNNYLKEVQDICLNSLENQEYPFEEIIKNIDVTRDATRNPVFDVMLVLQNNEEVELKTKDLTLKMIEHKGNTAKFDLLLSITPNNNKYILDLEFSTDLFSEQSAERFLKSFKEILSSILENPKNKICDIYHCDSESEKAIEGFNETFKEYNNNRTLVEIFEDTVKKHPDNIAVEHKDESITYRELNERSNALGEELREKGVGRDCAVGLVIDRSIEMIVGIYGILKAGGYYLPIDPKAPKERKEYMLKDAGATIYIGVEEFDLNIEHINIKGYSKRADNLKKINKMSDIAYIIYTSGTTGEPKGVEIENKAVINRIYWMNEKYPIYESSAILQKTSYTFDVSVWEMLWWGFYGAKVVMLEQGDEKSPEKICETIEKHKVTTMHFVPSMLNMFLTHLEDNEKEKEKLKTLKQVFASGEALSVESVKKFRKELTNQKLTNLYGPTEASIDVTYYDCDSSDIRKVPIGKPISNIKMHILDGINRCAIGMIGEIGISGIGLARGYRNKPELTAEKFIENPYGEGRIYRTGDLGRWLADGSIEYLGRVDDQVKIRGLRIELSEIENVARQIDKIKDVAIIVREINGEKAIHGYFVTDEINLGEIREKLSEKLLSYMIPQYMMIIDEIPVTKNGKLNKKTLPEIIVKSEKEYLAPRSEKEKILASVFEEILQVEQIGIDDNFFELGG